MTTANQQQEALLLCAVEGSGVPSIAAIIVQEDSTYTYLPPAVSRRLGPNEKEGIDYRTVSSSLFMTAAPLFIESSTLFGWHQGNLKKTFDEAITEGKKPIIWVRPKGLDAATNYCHEKGIVAVTHIICAPSANMSKDVAEKFGLSVQEVHGNCQKSFNELQKFVSDHDLATQALWNDQSISLTGIAHEARKGRGIVLAKMA